MTNMLKKLKEQVLEANSLLPKHGLVRLPEVTTACLKRPAQWAELKTLSICQSLRM
jgi:hypothetical protein